MRIWILALALWPGIAVAQSELPPAGYSGAEYVDRSGCAYVRANVGGATQWILRTDANRQPICGLQPTNGAAAVSPQRVVAPRPTAPVVQTAAPQLDRIAPPGLVVPAGYRAAWDDGRVNAHRGPQTAAGDAQMARVLTDDLPRGAVVEPDHSALRGPGPAYVEAGRFATLSGAQAGRDALGIRATQIGQGTLTGHYYLLIGPYANRDAAREGLDLAHAAGLGHLRIR